MRNPAAPFLTLHDRDEVFGQLAQNNLTAVRELRGRVGRERKRSKRRMVTHIELLRHILRAFKGTKSARD